MLAGLYKSVHPSIPDGRTWTKLGDHGEHGKDGKHQTDDLKHSIYDSKHTFCDSKHSICQVDDLKTHSFAAFTLTIEKNHTRKEKMILGRLKMVNHEAKCGFTKWLTEILNAKMLNGFFL